MMGLLITLACLGAGKPTSASNPPVGAAQLTNRSACLFCQPIPVSHAPVGAFTLPPVPSAPRVMPRATPQQQPPVAANYPGLLALPGGDRFVKVTRNVVAKLAQNNLALLDPNQPNQAQFRRVLQSLATESLAGFLDSDRVRTDSALQGEIARLVDDVIQETLGKVIPPAPEPAPVPNPEPSGTITIHVYYHQVND